MTYPHISRENSLSTELSKADWEQLDQFAWHVICNWSQVINFHPIYQGINFNHLVRFFLWDKVSRTIRVTHQKINSELEVRLINEKYSSLNQNNNSIKTKKHYLKDFLREVKAVTSTVIKCPSFEKENGIEKFVIVQDFKQRLGNRKNIFVPIFSPRIDALCRGLLQDQRIVLTGKQAFLEGVKVIPQVVQKKTQVKRYALKLYKSILRGLGMFKIQLLELDQLILQKQILELIYQFPIAEAEIAFLKPDVLLQHTDNHPPYQLYTMLAKKHNIPVFMLQHGLDCEHYFLEKAYASHIAVWGSNRKKRYENVNYNKSTIRVTGNPVFDHLNLKPKTLNDQGKYILWVTRPHKPEKCYAVSRNPSEGVDILNTLVKFIETHSKEILYIKPHPFSLVELYEKVIQEIGCSDGIKLVSGELWDYLPEAKVVITEDSTAGLEAMFFGKPILHVHFAPSKPTLPIVEYKAGFPGYSPEYLQQNLKNLLNLNQIQKQEMYIGQQAFIRDFAHALDGKSAERCMTFLNSILNL